MGVCHSYHTAESRISCRAAAMWRRSIHPAWLLLASIELTQSCHIAEYIAARRTTRRGRARPHSPPPPLLAAGYNIDSEHIATLELRESSWIVAIGVRHSYYIAEYHISCRAGATMLPHVALYAETGHGGHTQPTLLGGC
jgi:hypothetical protein